MPNTIPIADTELIALGAALVKINAAKRACMDDEDEKI